MLQDSNLFWICKRAGAHSDHKAMKRTLRETFFIDQLSAVGTVQMPLKGDFLVNGKYLFEVGGESKEFDQIAGIPDSYLAIAGIETGYSSRIPLWMFGFLY